MAETEKEERDVSKHDHCRVTILVRINDLEIDFSHCIKSLCNQILDDMEVLFLVPIKDESEKELSEAEIAEKKIKESHQEEKLSILNDYAKKDPRIKIIKTKVSDYGRLINAAIKFAKGEYIGIVEPVDYIDPEMYIELFALAKKHDADIVRSNYFEHRDEKDRIHESFLADDADKVIDPAKDTSIFYQPPVVGCGLYKKNFLLNRDLLFIENFGNSSQNDTFSFKTLAACNRLVLTEKAYLHHLDLDKKTPAIKKKEMFKINDEYAEAERYLKRHSGWDIYGKIFQAVKFASYFYNMLYLEDKNLEQFMLRARAEFHDADEKGLLAKSYFPKEHWKTLQSILKYPPRVFLMTIKKYRKAAK